LLIQAKRKQLASGREYNESDNIAQEKARVFLLNRTAFPHLVTASFSPNPLLFFLTRPGVIEFIYDLFEII
jgi:hypothetical protein